ncbi:acyltransferase family protein [Companilactobacillus insicii]|uniref:acyltransferase family protein n=1 Tax=Companilactobacillus insicii TaxID=1732567 RepID=UPI000F76B32D|nr:acyltransferase family protein [Companilactobacillus insicii]
MAKKRIDWIDIARCIAIISVIIGHTMAGLNGTYLYNVIYLYSLPVFFVLSGYLYHSKDYKKLLINDIKFLLIPYLAVNVIKLVVLFNIQHHIGNGIFTINLHSFQSLMVATLYGYGMKFQSFPVVNAIWFLLAMFIANQIFNLVMRINFRNYRLLWQGISAVLLTSSGFMIAHFYTLPFSINSALIAQIFLFFGYLMKNKDILSELKNAYYLLLLAAWLFVATLGTFYMASAKAPNELMAVVGAISASLCIIKLSIEINKYLELHGLVKTRNLLLFIGAQSLTVLCFHLLDLDCLKIYSDIIFGLSGKVPHGIPVLVGMLYRIFFAIGMTWLVRFIPIIRSLFMPRTYPIKRHHFQSI